MSLFITSGDVRILDGDTIRVRGTTYRLIGFDAPETLEARCPHEYRLGIAALQALARSIRTARSLTLCPAGIDVYSRTLATLTIDGHDAAEIMILSGHAREYAGGPRQPWCNCRRPSCNTAQVNHG